MQLPVCIEKHATIHSVSDWNPPKLHLRLIVSPKKVVIRTPAKLTWNLKITQLQSGKTSEPSISMPLGSKSSFFRGDSRLVFQGHLDLSHQSHKSLRQKSQSFQPGDRILSCDHVIYITASYHTGWLTFWTQSHGALVQMILLFNRVISFKVPCYFSGMCHSPKVEALGNLLHSFSTLFQKSWALLIKKKCS